MNIVERAKNILLNPQQEWRVIRDESASAGDMLRQYVAPLAAIPALAGFIGAALVGGHVLGVAVRTGVIGALAMAVVTYVLNFVAVFLLALTIDWLAPKFKSKPSQPRAFKLAVYGWTPAWLGGVFQIIPSLSPLGFLAALYAGYLIYVGVQELMATPAEEAAMYTVVVMVAVFVMLAVIGTIMHGGMGVGMY
ncbi:MAG: Yip1 family protein [Sphingomonadales bacterium]